MGTCQSGIGHFNFGKYHDILFRFQCAITRLSIRSKCLFLFLAVTVSNLFNEFSFLKPSYDPRGRNEGYSCSTMEVIGFKLGNRPVTQYRPHKQIWTGQYC